MKNPIAITRDSIKEIFTTTTGKFPAECSGNLNNHLDSLDVLELILAYENQFDIEIDDDTVDNLHTYRQVEKALLSLNNSKDKL